MRCVGPPQSRRSTQPARSAQFRIRVRMAAVGQHEQPEPEEPTGALQQLATVWD
jgi:hypothetical protein